MSFPFVFQENFDRGTKGNFDTEADTGSLLDFPHYSALAAVPGLGMPYRGAYCMRIQPGDTNDHTLTEADINISADGEGWTRFALWHDLEATADDIFNIYELQASSTVETAISIQVTAATGLVEIGIGETEASSFGSPLTPREWHMIELHANIDDGGSNDGAATLYVDGYSVQTLSSLDQGAITDGVLGTQGTLATTTGTILFDQFAFDSARVGPILDRWDESIMIHQSQHVFVGPGSVENVTLLAGAGTDCILRAYDTDTAYTTDQSNIRIELTNTANSETVDPAGVPASFHRGCYIEVSGTNPKFLVKLSRATGWGSEGAMRSWARTRQPGRYGA